jgi:beta-phosphoglucomutase-like phosphatase (HAD superfamily)
LLFEGIILDWDGTLADSKKVAVASFQKVLRSRKIALADEFIVRRMGTSAREIFKSILKEEQENYGSKTFRDLVEERIKAEIGLSGDVKLNDGALDLLNSLKGKFKLALATMNNGAVIKHLLHSMGMTNVLMLFFL